MKLIFETDNGDRFDVEVGTFDSLQQIKERIQTSQGFLSSKQTLSLDGNTIGSDIDLLCADIADESVLHLHIAAELPPPPPPPKVMVITIQLPPPFDAFDAEVDADDKVEKVKETIQERVGGTPIERIVLNHEMGMELPDGMTLLECQVLPRSRITVGILPEATSSQPASPPTPTATEEAASSSSFAGNRLSIVLKFQRRSVRVEVRAAQRVRQLRERLMRLENEYFFVHNGDLMDEDLSFISQNVAHGDVIEIFLGTGKSGEW